MCCHILSTERISKSSPVLTQSHAAQNLKPEGAGLIPTFTSFSVFSVSAAPHKVSAGSSFSVLVRQLSALRLQSGSCQLSRRGWCNHIHANTLTVIITALAPQKKRTTLKVFTVSTQEQQIIPPSVHLNATDVVIVKLSSCEFMWFCVTIVLESSVFCIVWLFFFLFLYAIMCCVSQMSDSLQCTELLPLALHRACEPRCSLSCRLSSAYSKFVPQVFPRFQI